jgi:hypothetical protein
VTDRANLTRRSLLVASAAAAVALPLARTLQERGYDRERRNAYEALVESLVAAGALPATGGEHGAAGERLTALYREALPARRREIDAVLDGLVDARFPQLPRDRRTEALRRWAAAGGDRRVLAARALALAGAAFGPTDRPLPVAIRRG